MKSKNSSQRKRKERKRQSKRPEHYDEQEIHPCREDDEGAWQDSWSLNGRMP